MSTYLEPIALTEASKSAELIAQLDKVPLGRMYQASFRAVIRAQMFFTGWTHELFAEFTDKARAYILKRATPPRPSPNSKGEFGEGVPTLDGVAGYEVQVELLKMWGDVFKEWHDRFYKMRVEAGSIPFGVLAVSHERLIVERLKSNVEERLTFDAQRLTEGVEDGVFSPQLSTLLNVSSEYLYDGSALNLSARVWNIDRQARDGMAQVILKGVTNADSAWNIAQELEQFLGASEDCPRWTSTRLYGRTKTQIAQGDTTGLVSKPCDGRGVSYNALRLARTEIQKAHALATDRIMAAQPWVKKEQVHLSEAHPEPDICDDIAHGGEGGKGIYEVGEIELPLHPNCLCYKTAVLMDEKQFTGQLNGWLKGEQEWAEMDAYAALVKGQRSNVERQDLSESILPNAINLAVWLFGDNLEKFLK